MCGCFLVYISVCACVLIWVFGSVRKCWFFCFLSISVRACVLVWVFVCVLYSCVYVWRMCICIEVCV